LQVPAYLSVINYGGTMKKTMITISGMSCGHCAMAVKKELSKLDGVTVNAVTVGSAEISSEEGRITEQTLRSAIEEAGYSVVTIQ
jgi:copper chaperone